MANSKEFSHITVTADDDDVVIQAGAVEEAAPEEAADEGDGAIDEVVEEAAGEAAEPAAAEEPFPAPASPAAAPTSAPRPAEGGYHETTLEDLESAKMSTTQKVIIVVAILGIVAFVAWYLLAH